MESKKHNISISDRLYKDIKDYCELNSLKLNEFVESLLKKSFAVEKFGESPFDFGVKSQEAVVVTPKSQKAEVFEEAVAQIIEKSTETMPTPEEIKDKTEEIFQKEEPKVEQKPKRKVTKLK